MIPRTQTKRIRATLVYREKLYADIGFELRVQQDSTALQIVAD